VPEEVGQLRLVVGVHAFACGAPFGFGGHDRDGTVFQSGRPRPGSLAGTRAAAQVNLLIGTGGDARLLTSRSGHAT
jgi:hypothetical protein